MAASLRMNKLKQTIQIKNKIIYVNNSPYVCCCNERRQKELSREIFSASQVTEIIRTYPIDRLKEDRRVVHRVTASDKE